MQFLGEFWRKLRFPLGRRQFNRDLEEEMRFHLEMKARDCGDAAARKEFGNVALLQEDSRNAWGWSAIDACAADVKYAARTLTKNAGFTAVAVLTMALGIGATTAVFSVVNAVVLRPLPFPHPERLATIWQTRQKSHEDRGVVSYTVFSAWKEQGRSLEQAAAWDGDSVQLMIAGEPVEISGARVSPGFFATFDIVPAMGRVFLADEHRQSSSDVAVLSNALWKRLGGDRSIIGKKVQFDRKALTVVGVMPRGFAYPPGSCELWLPHAVDDSRNRGARYLKVIARLKRGVTVSRAKSELAAIASHQGSASDGLGANVVPLDEQMIGDARRVLAVLMGAVGCVFLIACTNVANLLLVRATGRRRELALRLALGAGRWRLVRVLLAESLLLTAAGGGVGVAAAYWLLRVFVALDPIHLPRINEVAVDGAVLVYAAVAVLVTAGVFGLLPAFRGSLLRLDSGPGAGEFGKNRSRNILAAVQIALALMLLVGAGLLLRSFLARVSVPLGFRPEGSLAVELPWSANRRIDELLSRVRALPGVTAAGASTAFPQDAPFLSCGGCVEIEGRARAEGAPDETGLVVATPGFFEAAGMGLLRGRFFNAADGAESPKVAVLNEAMALRDFGGDDPLGRHVRWEGKEWVTIIGVAANVKGFGVASDPAAAIYFANRQSGWYNPVQVLVRTSVPPAGLTRAIRHEIRTWSPHMIIRQLDTVDNLLSSSVAAPRFHLLLIAGFALLALAVSAVGVYGCINYSVARRTHEIGIRLALGAERQDVLSMILSQGAEVTAAGIAIGLAGSWGASRLLETLLFGVRPTDGIAFAAGSGVLLLAALAASYVPARRATLVDPSEALRHE